MRRPALLVTGLLLAIFAHDLSAHGFEDPQAALDNWRADIALELLDAAPAPASADWHRRRGTALLAMGQGEAALEHLEKAVELEPEQAKNHYHLVGGLAANLDRSGAVGMLRTGRRIGRVMEQATELEPGNAEYQFGLFQYYLAAPRVAGGGTRRARDQAGVLAELGPQWGAGAEAMMLLAEGETDKAMQKMLAAWDEGKGVTLFGMPLVFNAQSREDWQTARSVLARILADAPNHPYAQYQLGRTAALAGDGLDAGKAALLAYTERPFIPNDSPSRAAAFWRLGQIHQHAGDIEQARAAWRQALELDPDFDEARMALEAESDAEIS
jgi:Flp pilus assembly protein TadD